MELIFKSKINLYFLNSQFEHEYQNLKTQSLLKHSKCLSFIMLLASIVTSSISFAYRYSAESDSFKFVKYSSYINTFLNLIGFLICIFCKNPKILRFIHYAAYIFIIFSAANLKYSLIEFVYNKTFIMIIILIIIEMNFRLVWSILNIMSFSEYFFLNLIEILIIWTCLLPTCPPSFPSTKLYLICYTVLFIICSLSSYIIEKRFKCYLFYKLKYQYRMRWLNNVFESANTGILSIKGNSVTYMNNFLQTFLKQELNSYIIDSDGNRHINT